MLRMFQLGSRNRASVTPATSSAKTDVAQSRICVMYVAPNTLRQIVLTGRRACSRAAIHVSPSDVPRWSAR